jgi:hypothetical protein
MKKTRRLNALGSFFLVGLGLLIVLFGSPGQAAAAVPFSDNFESYSLGTLAGQGDWLTHYSGCTVVDSPTKTGSRAVSCSGDDVYRLDGDPISNSTEWEAWVYRPLGGGNRDFFIIVEDEDGTEVNKVRWLDATGNFYCANTQVFGSLSGKTAVWVKLGLKWNSDTGVISCGIDGTWTDFSSYTAWDKPVSMVKILAQNSEVMILDDLQGIPVTPPVVTGYAPVITPTTPEDGVTTVEDLTDFTVSGEVEIPTLNENVWRWLNVHFTKFYSTEVTTKNFMFPTDLVGGDSYLYNATTTLDDAFAYHVTYSIVGETPEHSGVVEYHAVYGTYVTHTAPTFPVWIDSPGWTVPELEDCDALSGVDKIICEIKNVLLGLIIPSQGKVDELTNTVAAFNNKFPINYLKAVQTFFTDVQSGLDEDKAIAFEVFGQAGTMDVTFWNTPVTIGGVSQSIGAIFKSFIAALFVISFLAWSINFVKRIF